MPFSLILYDFLNKKEVIRIDNFREFKPFNRGLVVYYESQETRIENDYIYIFLTTSINGKEAEAVIKKINLTNKSAENLYTFSNEKFGFIAAVYQYRYLTDIFYPPEQDVVYFRIIDEIADRNSKFRKLFRLREGNLEEILGNVSSVNFYTFQEM